ncbi:hypothetical protein [Calothrix sp. NIES-2100]
MMNGLVFVKRMRSHFPYYLSDRTCDDPMQAYALTLICIAH